MIFYVLTYVLKTEIEFSRYKRIIALGKKDF